MITQKITYVTSDGTEFPTELEAKRYENEQHTFSSSNARKFIKGYRGKALLKMHTIDEYGTWEVTGEDSNCDLGGSHYMPQLGIFTGTLKDVINKAVELPKFWQWGSGGDIKKVEINIL